jgi:hypothetical protein
MITDAQMQNSPLKASGCMVVSIHQPNYIPWLGYFFKIAHADKFVFLDSVIYPKSSYVNRNSIKTQKGPALLTVPVRTSGKYYQLIEEVQTVENDPWAYRHLATLQCNYAKARYFSEIFELLRPHYEAARHATSLAGFNIGLILTIADYLGLKTQFVRASDLGRISGQKTDLIREICLALSATSYLAGTGARSYQEDAKLEEAKISPLYSTFSYPTYPQQFGEFIPNLSIVDVLMNCGARETRRLLGLEHSTTERSQRWHGDNRQRTSVFAG